MKMLFGCRQSRLLATYARLENEEDEARYLVINADGKCELVNTPSTYTHELVNMEFPNSVCKEVDDVYPALHVEIETTKRSLFSKSTTEIVDEAVLFPSQISSCNHVLLYCHQCNLCSPAENTNMHVSGLCQNEHDASGRYHKICSVQIGKCAPHNVHTVIEDLNQSIVVCLHLSDTGVLSIRLIRQAI